MIGDKFENVPPVLFCLSSSSCSACSFTWLVLRVPFCLFSSAWNALPIPFCLSCSGLYILVHICISCPSQHVPFYLSCSVRPVPTVPFCLSCRPALPFLFAWPVLFCLSLSACPVLTSPVLSWWIDTDSIRRYNLSRWPPIVLIHRQKFFIFYP
jgi:hypothetical protein